jgi:colanic acid/amylovoran biosynthesis glycosyltransferase
MTLTMIHANSISIEGDLLRVDRKFHLGMLAYADQIREPIVSFNPRIAPNMKIMDEVELRLSELPYSIRQLRLDSRGKVLRDDELGLARQIRASSLIYGGAFGASEISKAHGIPYILVLETDLQTQLVLTRSTVNGFLRKTVRSARCIEHYFRKSVPAMRNATAVHCNGYPVFYASAAYNANRLLYLDSRMTSSMLMSTEALEEKFKRRKGRPWRLFYSGRYEAIKGALDVVQAVIECVKQGLPVELDCYGQGTLKSAMLKAVERADVSLQVRIHDAVPYPVLVKLAREADLFVCCHVQSDPSCTYLESMGAGLAIVGYLNRMWVPMQEASGAGVVVPLRRPVAMAEAVSQLLASPERVNTMSRNALAFAARHVFESEFKKRTDALNDALSA